MWLHIWGYDFHKFKSTLNNTVTITYIRLALRPCILNPAGYYPQFYKTRDRVWRRRIEPVSQVCGRVARGAHDFFNL